MSLESISLFPVHVKVSDVTGLLDLLGYRKIIYPQSRFSDEIAQYLWSDHTDYRSDAGIWLSVVKNNHRISVCTRTTSARSYYDLEKQNETIRILKRYLGGTFTTDEGKNRYFIQELPIPTPAQAGCDRAFQNFGSNLIKASIYQRERNFSEHIIKARKIVWFQDMDPIALSNNLLLVYLCTILEEYFKSTYIAILKYSSRKEECMKDMRLSSDQLFRISNKYSVEEAIAETLPLTRISSISKQFTRLDPKLDIAGCLRKPYHRRTTSLFDKLEQIGLKRNAFIHRGILDFDLDEDSIKLAIDDIEACVDRCYRRITSYYGWPYDKSWARGKKRKRAKPLDVRRQSKSETKAQKADE